MLDDLRRIIGTELDASYVESRPGDVKHSLADFGKAEGLLGYRPAIDFCAGLERTVAYLRDQVETGAPAAGTRL